MKKLLSITLILFFGVLLLDSCKKTTDVITPAIPAVVGVWKLDRIIVTELPTTYASINGKSLDPLQFFAYQSVYNFVADNTFTDKETQSGVIQDLTGKWVFATNQLSLTYSDNSTDGLVYDDVSKLLSSVPASISLNLTNPTTQIAENVPCKIQVIYVKQ
jgi:hypothetical protein